jgi:hypothetical protein
MKTLPKPLTLMNKNFFYILLLLVSTPIFSQNYQGNISGITQNGYHKILLSPEVRSAGLSNTNFFRIIDSHKNEVPYVLLKEKNKTTSNFLPFIYKSINNTQDSLTSIIIENTKQQKLDHLTFKISNTKVKKRYTISGSNNEKEWFGLTNNELFLGLKDPEKTTVEQTFTFPINDYKYLKFEFGNKKSLPLHILDIGLYENMFSSVAPLEITKFKTKISNDNENKTTRVSVVFDIPQHIEMIDFDIENNVFLRDARIFVNRSKFVKKRTENYQDDILRFELHSDTHNTFDLPYLFEKEIIVEIQNYDNQPLTIKHIKFFQKPLYVVSNLKSTESYQVIIDSTLHKPKYDLINFKTSLNTNLPESFITDFNKINTQDKTTIEKSFWQTKVFMWLCILLAVIVIGYFALGLLKDLKN